MISKTNLNPNHRPDPNPIACIFSKVKNWGCLGQPHRRRFIIFQFESIDYTVTRLHLVKEDTAKFLNVEISIKYYAVAYNCLQPITAL